MNPSASLPVGVLLREWRQRRHLSQLDLAGDAEVSTRHLSYVETGRALPSREMVLRLADRLEVPLRERNRLLTAAGYAPMFVERKLDDPALTSAREAIDLLLKGHEPYPALAVDRHWNLVSHNRALAPLLQSVSPKLLEPPVNVLRLGLHPDGLAPRIVNLGQWRAHLLDRLRLQVIASADPVLSALADELHAYPAPAGETPLDLESSIVVPMTLATTFGIMSFISTTTVFGTPVDITLAELALETFFPADAKTREILRSMALASGNAS